MSGEKLEHDNRNWLARYWKLAFIPLSLLISCIVIANRQRLQDAAIYGYPGVFVVSLLGNATIIFPAPSLALVFAMGSILNPLWVGIAAGAGEALGELTGFMAGYGGQVVVERYDIYHRFRRYMERYGLIAIFILSAIPNPSSIWQDWRRVHFVSLYGNSSSPAGGKNHQNGRRRLPRGWFAARPGSVAVLSQFPAMWRTLL